MEIIIGLVISGIVLLLLVILMRTFAFKPRRQAPVTEDSLKTDREKIGKDTFDKTRHDERIAYRQNQIDR